MKKLILIVRDCGYLQWQRAKHNHEEALQKGNEFAVFLLTMSWSMPVLSFLAIASNRLGYGPYAHYLRLLTNCTGFPPVCPFLSVCPLANKYN
ncbi:hypothetical protein GO730_35880 [Spirosoma sp. HMF3257]|uniref:hypothetical protein n=1 Tax=Spirosoma telluris TaxID=2183553 RepID=UPI0011B935EF|nr:hypothetical protein [Spirosoma telluris]